MSNTEMYLQYLQYKRNCELLGDVAAPYVHFMRFIGLGNSYDVGPL